MVWITKNFDVLVNVLKPFLAVHAIDFQSDLNFLIHKDINLQQSLKCFVTKPIVSIGSHVIVLKHHLNALFCFRLQQGIEPQRRMILKRSFEI